MLWKSLRHFSQDENWGAYDQMDPWLLLLLEELRDYVETPIAICCGTQGSHAPKSQHYAGKAVDIVFPKFGGAHRDLLLKIMSFPFTGIGFYPHWYYGSNSNVIGGYHLDIRKLGPTERRATWIGTVTKTKRVYIALTHDNMMREIINAV
jgi:uncharacterized protein YcbK (DUF882 family)